MFQVLLLENDASDDVEVQEADQSGFLPSERNTSKTADPFS